MGSPWSDALWSINSRSKDVLDEGPDVVWESCGEADIDFVSRSNYFVTIVTLIFANPGTAEEVDGEINGEQAAEQNESDLDRASSAIR